MSQSATPAIRFAVPARRPLAELVESTGDKGDVVVLRLVLDG